LPPPCRWVAKIHRGVAKIFGSLRSLSATTMTKTLKPPLHFLYCMFLSSASLLRTKIKIKRLRTKIKIKRTKYFCNARLTKIVIYVVNVLSFCWILMYRPSLNCINGEITFTIIAEGNKYSRWKYYWCSQNANWLWCYPIIIFSNSMIWKRRHVSIFKIIYQYTKSEAKRSHHKLFFGPPCIFNY
jgi:hypothetical protein